MRTSYSSAIPFSVSHAGKIFLSSDLARVAANCVNADHPQMRFGNDAAQHQTNPFFKSLNL